MKKAYVFILAMLLVLTGCGGENKKKDVSVTDVCCPYKLQHKEQTLQITLEDAQESGLTWQVKLMPEGICQAVRQDSKKNYVACYDVIGIQEGAAQLTLTAVQEDQTVDFTLSVVVNVDAQGNVTLASSQHQQREHTLVETEDFTYEWDVDVNGVLNFRFSDSEDLWSISGDGGEVCTILSSLSTPSGCKFSARPESAGQVSILLIGEFTQREIAVVLQADEAGNLEVVEVREQ